MQAWADYIFPGIVSQRPDYVSCPYLENIEQEELQKLELARKKASNSSSNLLETKDKTFSSSDHVQNNGRSYFHATDENGYEIISSYGNNVKKERRNADGSISYIWQSQCVICHGTKTCTSCYGRGGRWSGYGFNKIWMSCGMCGGSGACRTCSGNGHTVHSGMIDPHSQYAISMGSNGNIYVTTSEGGTVSNYTSSKSNEHSQPWHYGNDEPLCPDCNGVGKCHHCQGDGIYFNSYCDKYLDCSLCHHTGICPMCHGRGSIR